MSQKQSKETELSQKILRQTWDHGCLHRLAIDKIDVWHAALPTPLDKPADLPNPRSVLERGALQRLRHGQVRSILNSLLGRYLGVVRVDVPLERSIHGKPRVDARFQVDPPLYFNVSHSEGHALLAFSDQELGIDIEARWPPDFSSRLAERAFGALRAERLATLDPEDRARAFLRLWTRNEALLKWSGVGLWGTWEAPHRQACIQDLDAGPGLIAAVASEHPSELKLRHWPAAASE